MISATDAILLGMAALFVGVLATSGKREKTVKLSRATLQEAERRMADERLADSCVVSVKRQTKEERAREQFWRVYEAKQRTPPIPMKKKA